MYKVNKFMFLAMLSVLMPVSFVAQSPSGNKAEAQKEHLYAMMNTEILAARLELVNASKSFGKIPLLLAMPHIQRKNMNNSLQTCMQHLTVALDLALKISGSTDSIETARKAIDSANKLILSKSLDQKKLEAASFALFAVEISLNK